MAGVYRIYPKKRRNLFSSLSVNLDLIILNVIVFVGVYVLLAFNRNNPMWIYDYIAIKPANILAGKYLWTFLTSMFMHGGFFHLFMNMLSLFFVGGLVEKILGAKRYLYFYLGSGLFAGVLFVLSALIFPSDLNAYAVGASGALFGLVGFLMLITPNLPVYIMFVPIPIKMKYAAPGMLFVLWLVSIGVGVPIGNTAHLGGLLAGVFYGLYVKKKYKRKSQMIDRMFSR